MKSKLFTLFTLSILSLILLMGAVHAAFVIEPIVVSNIPSSVDHDAGSFVITFDLNNSGGDAGTVNFTASTVTTGASISFSDGNIAATTTKTITATINFPNTLFGNISGTIDADGQQTLNFIVSVDAPTEIQSCTSNPGDLSIRKIDFNNKGFSHNEFGKDDEWFSLDEMEVEMEVENDGDYNVDNIEVSWGIYALDREEWLIDFDDEDEFNLKDGKEETLKISFKLDDDLDIDLEDFSDDTNNYRFYVVASGTIDDSDSPNDEDDTCAFDFETAEIVIENDFVVLDNIDFPETVMCGDTVQVSADVWNIGEDDQDEVSVFVSNKELDLRKDIMVGDIDEFDNADLDFTFKVPKNVEEKTYAILFEVFDEGGDIYETDDDDNSEFRVPFRVDCGEVSDVGEVTISASLQSGGQAGQDLVVRATVTNNEDELQTFTVNAAGYAQWASSYTADRTSLVLGAGSSADVLFTFDVNKDASGSQSFTIELVSDENQVTTQPVSVAIEGRSGLFGLTGAVTSGNAYLWGIGILNVILVVIIVIVAVRVARR